MNRLYDREEEFEAEISILTEEEGGRMTPPLNGIRWDFLYAVDEPTDGIFMIWPEFIDENGNAIAKDIPLIGTYKARMHVLTQETKHIHRKRMRVGTDFYCVEGPHKVAKGSVTKITGLLSQEDET